jgi:hypothetical protein
MHDFDEDGCDLSELLLMEETDTLDYDTPSKISSMAARLRISSIYLWMVLNFFFS